MKQFIAILLIFAFLITPLTSCSEIEESTDTSSETIEDETKLMTQLFCKGLCEVWVHDDTGVMYILNCQGGIAVMTDSDGNVLVYNE